MHRSPRLGPGSVLGLAFVAILVVPAAGDAGNHDATPLTLPRAEALAEERDAPTSRFRGQASALDEEAVAAGQLPDPQLRTGVTALPVEGFRADDDPMTQWQVGISQAFPPGDTRRLRTERVRALAGEKRAQARDRERQVVRGVRHVYLEAQHQAHAAAVVDETIERFDELVEVTQRQFAAGRVSRQDVLRAQLERETLEDRLTRIRTAEDEARAELARWVGREAAARPLPKAIPELAGPADRQTLEARLADHPSMEAETARIRAGQRGVDLARQRYKPGWRVELGYSYRGARMADGSRASDLTSAMVVVDLPLFTAQRQDRRLAASQHELQAAHSDRLERLRALDQELGSAHARWTRLGERVERYERELLEQARMNAEAALDAYRAGTVDFTAVARAFITELDTRLDAHHLRVKRAQAQARLLYLAGGES